MLHDTLRRYLEEAEIAVVRIEDAYPHHKHVRDSVGPSTKPSVQQVIEEAVQFLHYSR